MISAFPEIQVGKIPAMGDNYYDGILEAHNDNYFISWEEPSEDDQYGHFLVYKMDSIFKYCLEPPKFERSPEVDYVFPRSDGYERADLSVSAYASFTTGLLLLAREHAKGLKPIGWCSYDSLERV